MISLKQIIDIITFIIIGIIQGITEIFPVSSSGHLALCYYYFNVSNEIQLDLTIFLHLASSIALFIFFKNKILELIKGTFLYLFKKDKTQKENFMLVIYILIASIPITIVGFFIKPLIENLLSNIKFILIGFMITAILLLVNSFIKEQNKSSYDFKNTLITGLIQCFSVFPAISRSGVTLLGSKIAKLDHQKGKEFTFLLLIPISFGSSLLSIFDVIDNKIAINENIFLYLISMIVAFVFTLISLRLFFYKSKKIKIYVYSIYLILLSLINIILI